MICSVLSHLDCHFDILGSSLWSIVVELLRSGWFIASTAASASLASASAISFPAILA